MMFVDAFDHDGCGLVVATAGWDGQEEDFNVGLGQDSNQFGMFQGRYRPRSCCRGGSLFVAAVVGTTAVASTTSLMMDDNGLAGPH